MQRFRLPEIALGCIIGITLGIVLQSILLFQTQHCGEEYGCGIVGFPFALVRFMDHHEGFFVGTFTSMLFFATLLLWRSTHALWKAGGDQLRLTKQIFAADIRPWLSAEPQVGPLKNGEKALTLSVTYKIRNIGKSPALGVRLMQRLGIGYDDGHYEAHKAMEAFSEECRALIPTEASRRFGPTIFPNDEPAEIGWPSTISKDELNVLLADVEDKEFTIDVLAIIQYVSPADNEWHQTRYIFNLWRAEADPTEVENVAKIFSYFRPDTPDHPYTQLELHKTPFGAFAD